MTSRVLVTGGAGFIGGHLIRRLTASGHEITVLDNLSPQVHGDVAPEDVEATLGDGVRLVVGDVQDADAWRRCYDGQDVVVHLAAETGTGQSMYEATRYCQVNVDGTARLLDLMTNQDHGIERVIVASSRSIYGEGSYRAPDGAVHHPGARSLDDLRAGRFELYDADGTELEAIATDESAAIHPTSVYGITKSTQEQLVLRGCAALGVTAVGLRYQNVYGPGQSLSNPYTGILSIFTSLIRDGAVVNVFEDGAESRDFVFVDDVARATQLAVEAPVSGQLALNIGSGVPTSVLEVVEQLALANDREVEHRVSGDFRLGDIRHNWADLDLARRTLGFEPTVSFADGVALFATWARDEDASSAAAYEKSLQEMRSRNLMG